jgi:hypothetical protein
MPVQSVSDGEQAVPVAGSILFALAAACIARSWLPDAWTGTHWDGGSTAFAAFYFALLGLGLVQGSDPARRFLILATGLLTLACGLALVVASARGRLLGAALAALAVGLAGLAVFPPASRLRTTVCAALAVAGLLAAVPSEILLAREPGDEARRRLAEWSLPDRSYAAAEDGVSLNVPGGWVLLRQGHPFTRIPGATVELAHGAPIARAALHVDRDAGAGDGLDGYLDRHLERWRRVAPNLQEQGRSPARIGDVPARRLDVAWTEGQQAYSGYTIAWRDSSTLLAWSAWHPARATDSELDRLQAALAVKLPLTSAVSSATAALATEMPQLSPSTVAAVLSRKSWLARSSPGVAFREVLLALSRGFALLDREQVHDMGEVNAALYGSVPPGDRERLAGYMDRVRALQPTTVEEDLEAMRATRAAVERLPENRRTRLRTIMDSAVLAGIGGRPAGM